MTEAKHHRAEITDSGYKNQGIRGNNSLSGAPTKLVIREIIQEDGEIGYVLVSSKVKFDEEAQQIFLTEIARHGRLGTAARASGVTITTARRHVKQNPAFAEAMMESIEVYKDRLINHHQNLVFNGTVKRTYDRNGNVVSEETVYPIRLIELELKKHDSGYRDRQEVTHEHRGGTLVVPGQLSAKEWEERFRVKKEEDVEDAEFKDVSEDPKRED